MREDGAISEYQYYEFLALDKPLTETGRAELRQLSDRAEITATGFVSEYHYGDFRGDPSELMDRYFDAFLYLANWGTRHLMFRLPSGVLAADITELYCYTDAADFSETDDHLVISLLADREPGDDWLEPDEELGLMIGVRPELAAGDLRLLYLGWLLAIQTGHGEEEDTEPPVPAGLGKLSAPLQAIVEFLEIDENLIAVAAEASPDTGPAVPSVSPRTVAELLKAAEDLKAVREKAAERREREERARTAAAEAAAYDRHLDDLMPRAENAWKRIADLIETRSPREYDQAVVLLRDLRALAEREGDSARFSQRFLRLRTAHARMPSLLARLDQARLPR